jgi:hypothetical protein
MLAALLPLRAVICSHDFIVELEWTPLFSISSIRVDALQMPSQIINKAIPLIPRV